MTADTASSSREPADMPPSLLMATVVLDELVRTGVRHVVLSPGSRSAPLAYAALAAERAGALTLHVRTDERAAAFTALGVGLATGTPAAVVTTSGTAVANLHPAVFEAHEGRVPLLLLTSDRPHEVRHTRANQTTSQPGMFGHAARLAVDLEAAAHVPLEQHAARSRRAAYWRGTVVRAVAAARGDLSGLPGPVQVNISLAEPLAPARAAAERAGNVPVESGGRLLLGSDALPAPERGRPHGQPWTRVEVEGSATPGEQPRIPHAPRTLVVLGHVPEDVRRHALRWAATRRHPVLAGPFGTDPDRGTLPHGSLLAETAWAVSKVAAPERVVVVGRLTLSRAVAALVRRAPVRELVTTDAVWPDPSHTMQAVYPAGVLRGPESSSLTGTESDESERFRSYWREAADRLDEVVDSHVPSTWPSGPAAAYAVLSALPAGARLFLGSSSTVRDVAFTAGSGLDLRLAANRGLAGIDGCVSTAAGMALAEPDVPTYALVGDLTFLHDSAALAVGPLERRPDLTVVVVNDDGGAIFDTLEYGAPQLKGADEAAYTRLFSTPTGTDLEALAAAHRVRYRRAHTAAELRDAVCEPPDGLSVIEVRVPSIRARRDRAELVAAASAALM